MIERRRGKVKKVFLIFKEKEREKRKIKVTKI
jgi:hypothetical protein